MKIILLETGANLGPILSFFGSLIIAGVSVGIFVCDGRRTKREKKEQEERELKDLYDYFQKLIHGIIDNLKKQNEEIDTRASEIKNNPFNFHQLTFFVNKDFDRLSERMNLEKLYKAYLMVNKNHRNNNDDQIKENFQGIIISVDLARGIINQVKDTHIEHSNYLENKLRSFKELVEEEITKEAGLLARRIRNLESENKEAKKSAEKIDNIIIYYSKIPKYDLNTLIIKEYLIDPVKYEIVYYLQDFKGGVYIADKCRKASFLFTEIKDEGPILSNQLQEFSKQLENERQKLENTSF